MKNLVLLLEEPSARDLLEGLLPRILPPDVAVFYLIFEGKQDLEKQLVRKLRHWQKADSAFLILRDQDAAECKVVKNRLLSLVADSGREKALVRVACRDLEAWVLGDWLAIAQAYERPALAAQARKAAFREPDQILRPVEVLRRFLPEYQKRDGARRVGPLLDPNRNQSASFRAFCSGVLRLVAEEG